MDPVRFLAALMVVFTTFAGTEATQPRALVYRGPSACRTCSEAVAQLLETSPQKFSVTFVGPYEDIDIGAASLSKADVYAQPGGPDLDSAWSELQEHASEIRDFVENQGGRYLGFCLGAYLAGKKPGFGLLPEGASAVSERKEKNAQVTHTKDSLVQVDWKFSTEIGNHREGETATNQWLYFQDGTAIKGLSGYNNTVLARYSTSGNIAASLTPLGRGWIALVGPHPEATEKWYRDYRLSNPDGVDYDVGHDFLAAAMQAGQSTKAKPTSDEESGVNDWGRGRGRMTLQNPVGWIVRGLTKLWW